MNIAQTQGDQKNIWLLRHIWTDDKGRKHCYTIYARAVVFTIDKSIGMPSTSMLPTGINWDTYDETAYTIVGAPDIPKGAVIQYWTETGMIGSGQHAVSRSEPSYIKKGLAKRTLLEQATLNIKSKFDKYVKAHSVSLLPFPQAVHKYEDQPMKKELLLRYPLDIQPKLDGVRVVANISLKSDVRTRVMSADILLYSRRREEIVGQNEVRKDLQTLALAVRRHMYLDGEFFVKGMPLQQISGIVRRADESASPLEYHVFDVFGPTILNADGSPMVWQDRKALLDELADVVRINNLSRIKIVQSVRVGSAEEGDAVYANFLRQGYEGAIYRNLDAVYEYGTVKEIRTYGARKRKPRYDGEYTVIGFTEGTHGKDKGAIIWVLSTEGAMNTKVDPPTPYPSVKTFNAVPNMSNEERTALFAELSKGNRFAKEFLGKKMTIEYDDISEDGVPVRARAVGLRGFA
jgi:hypothetical protein